MSDSCVFLLAANDTLTFVSFQFEEFLLRGFDMLQYC